MSSTCTTLPIAPLIKTGDRKAVPSLSDQSLDAGPGIAENTLSLTRTHKPCQGYTGDHASAQLFIL